MSLARESSIHLAGLAALTGWAALAWISRVSPRPLWGFLIIQSIQWLIWAWAYSRAGGHPSRKLLWAIIGWAVAFRLCGGCAWPLMEDDYFRFLWDGYQFGQTGNPYQAEPAAFFADPTVPEPFQAVLDQVNYPHVPTIYGPVCQWLFLGSYALAPAQLWPWKALLMLFDLGLLWAGIALARGESAVPRPGPATAGAVRAALILGWAPLMVFETSFNAHPDMVGVGLLAVSLLLAGGRRWVWVGVTLGLAVGAKVLAVLMVPFLLRHSAKGWLAFGATLLGLYLPFWVQGSWADARGLIAYSTGWEFNSSVFALAQWAVGTKLARLVCGGAFVAVWLGLIIRQGLNPTDGTIQGKLPPGLVIFGLLWLLSPTVNPWYLLWLAPFLTGQVSWTALAAWALVPLSYATGLNVGDADLANFEHPVWVRPVEFGLIGLVAVWEARRRRDLP